MRPYSTVALLTLMLLQTGCGLLLGNVKPVDQKADDYGVANLEREDADWVKLGKETTASPDPDAAPDAAQTDIPDVAYQSKKTASVISLSSACRPSVESQERSLREFTDLLLLGISDVKVREEKDLTVNDAPALQTTIQGMLNGESVKLRTVVLKRRECLYDLSLVARPDTFARHEETFSHFVASLRLR